MTSARCPYLLPIVWFLFLSGLGCGGGGQERAGTTFTSMGAEQAYEEGVVAQRDGDLTRAEERYRQAIGINSRYLAAYLGLGQVLLQNERYDEALAVFDQAIAIRDRSAEGHSGRAEALLRLGRAEEAAQAASHAIELGADIQGSLIHAQALDILGQTDEAIAILEQAVQREPARTDIRILLANMYLAQNRASAAVPLLERGARRDPNDYPAWLALAELYQQLEIWDKATETWQELVRMSQGAAYPLMQLGEAQLRAGSHLLALQSLDQAILADPTLARAHVLHGQAEMIRGYPDQARRDVDRALALDPDDLDTLLLLARIQERQNQADQAMATLEQALARHPEAFQPAAELARIHSSRGEFREVIAILEPRRDQIASNSEVNLLMVNAYLAVENVDAALTYLVGMTADNPDNAELHRQTVETALASPDQSAISSGRLVELAQRALQLSGGQRLEYRLLYIDALINDGQRRLAREVTRAALADIPNNPDLLERLERLD